MLKATTCKQTKNKQLQADSIFKQLNNMLKFTKTIEDINALHAQDPNKVVIDGHAFPQELIYTQRLVDLLADYAPNASIELQLAAHCQHIRRWAVNRTDFEMNRLGYFQWRKAEEKNQTDAARQILESRGWDDAVIDTVVGLMTKKYIKTNVEAQQLEDVACLTFVKYYLDEFAEKHEESKIVDIIKKTMNKMSAKAIGKTAELGLSSRTLDLVGKASQ